MECVGDGGRCVGGNCRDALGQLAGGYPQSVNVTPEEREAIERVSVVTWGGGWELWGCGEVSGGRVWGRRWTRRGRGGKRG